jgi:hypothetical protein
MSARWRDKVLDPAMMETDEIRAELRHDLRVYERVQHPLSKVGMARRIERRVTATGDCELIGGLLLRACCWWGWNGDAAVSARTKLLTILSWPFTLWPRWTRFELYVARRRVADYRREMGWDE